MSEKVCPSCFHGVHLHHEPSDPPRPTTPICRHVKLVTVLITSGERKGERISFGELCGCLNMEHE